MIFRLLCVALVCVVGVKAYTMFDPATASTSDKSASGEQVVNVYSARKEHLVKGLFEDFTAKTGIEVNFVTDKAGKLISRLKAEGKASPADVFMTADVGNLSYAREEGVIAPFESALLKEKVPAKFRRVNDAGQLEWVGLTVRARALVYAKDRVKPEELSTYEDLANEKWKGKILVRSSSNIYNQSLLASLIEADGAEKAEQWAKAIVGNMARTPQGGDTDQIKAVAAGEGDVAIANSYYFGRILASENAEDKAVAEKVAIFFPNQAGRGTHVNISGGAVTRHAKHKANAVKFLEYLASDDAQKRYAEVNQEFPMVANVPASDVVKSFGGFKRDALPLTVLSEHRAEVLKTFDRVEWR